MTKRDPIATMEEEKETQDNTLGTEENQEALETKETQENPETKETQEDLETGVPPEEVKLPVKIDQMEAETDAPEKLQREEDPAEVTEEGTKVSGKRTWCP